MTKMAKLVYLILISILIEAVVLVSAEAYLGRSGEIRVTNTDIAGYPKTGRNVAIPEGSVEIKASQDGAYAGYILNGKLAIIDMNSRSVVKTISYDNSIITFYKWLPDRNMLIYSIKSSRSNMAVVKIFTYDAESSAVRNYPELSNLPSESRISWIELSTLTNIVYFKVDTGKKRSVIYKLNITSDLELILTTDSSAVIRQANYSDKLVISDSSDNLYCLYGGKESRQFPAFAWDSVLVGIDSNDILYVAGLNEKGMVNKVVYGKIGTTSMKLWKDIELEQQCLPEELYLTNSGDIYERLGNGSRLIELSNKNAINIKGVFCGILDDYIITVYRGRLWLNIIKYSNASQSYQY